MITNAKSTSENEQLLQAITIRQRELNNISSRLIELESTEQKSKHLKCNNKSWFEENSNALLPALLPKAI